MIVSFTGNTFSVTPSNILRYNQVYKVPVQSSNATKEFSRVIESLSYEASQCSSRSQVDSRSSKEQAKVFYRVSTRLYTIVLMSKAW